MRGSFILRVKRESFVASFERRSCKFVGFERDLYEVVVFEEGSYQVVFEKGSYQAVFEKDSYQVAFERGSYQAVFEEGSYEVVFEKDS
jgi:hypothetical protein